tara:strand:- start:108 stop:773 length:666 start_codon:yes stop_codon:yes gene_type:complete
VPVFDLIRSEKRPGMALNVSKNLMALGNDVKMHTNSEIVTKERFVDNKTMQHLLRIDTKNSEKIKPIDYEILNEIDFSQFDGIVLSDYDKGFLTRESISYILGLVGELPVFADSKKDDLSCFDGCFVKVNEQEYQKATRHPKNSELIVTLGKNGAMWNNKRFEVKETGVFDVCGAGDTFLSAFVTGYLSTNNIEEAITFANYCASIAVSKFGTYAVGLKDL